jgi:hypothetical protein
MSLSQRGLGPYKPLDRTERETKQAHIWTSIGAEVRGTVYLVRGTRTIDLMERNTEVFIAVTNASVAYRGDIEDVGFIAINKEHVVMITEIMSEESDEEE